MWADLFSFGLLSIAFPGTARPLSLHWMMYALFFFIVDYMTSAKSVFGFLGVKILLDGPCYLSL